MLTFECWIDIQSAKNNSGTYQQGFRDGAKAAWDFFNKKSMPKKTFNPKKLLKNQPPFMGEEDELKFMAHDLIQ